MSWPDPNHLRWTPTLRVPSDDGTEIAVEILGDNHTGPTLVFVHGWTFSSRSWHYQRMLAGRHRLRLLGPGAPPARAHGPSGPRRVRHRTPGAPHGRPDRPRPVRRPSDDLQGQGRRTRG